MIIDYGPIPEGPWWVFSIVVFALFGLGIISPIFVPKRLRKSHWWGWGVVIVSVMSFWAFIGFGIVATLEHQDRYTEAMARVGSMAGYTEVQPGPDHTTWLGYDERGQLVVLNIENLPGDRYLVTEREGVLP